MISQREAILLLGLLSLGIVSPAMAQHRTPAGASIELRTSPRLNVIQKAEEKAAMDRAIERAETLCKVGKVFTWTGIGAMAAGTILFFIAWTRDDFIFNEYGHASAITGLVGLGALAAGIPMWAVGARRATRLRQAQKVGMPAIWLHAATRTVALGWSVRF